MYTCILRDVHSKNMKSVVSYEDRGNYGNNKYRGNCSGRLIEDIIQQYKLKSLSDLMVGSGTTEDVCRTMGIPGTFLDLNRGYDMLSMDIPERMQNCFWHPPYADIIVYSDKMYRAQDIIDRYGFDPREHDLSRCKDWEDFVRKMNYCCLKQFASLEKGGQMFVLMGDIKKRGRLYSMLADIAKPGTLEQIIIKMQHNCVSDRNVYTNQNFVPIVHEYLMVLKKEAALLYQIAFTKKREFDVRDSWDITWRDVVCAVIEDNGGFMELQNIYAAVDGHRKCQNNPHWRDKIRQTLYTNSTTFVRKDNGWTIKAA